MTYQTEILKCVSPVAYVSAHFVVELIKAHLEAAPSALCKVLILMVRFANLVVYQVPTQN